MPNSSVIPLTNVPTVAPTSTTLSSMRPMPEHESDQGSTSFGYVFLPVAAVVVLLVASALVLMLLRKRRIDRLRHHLMPLYNFDATDDDPEEWEAELLDDISESRSLRRGYKSMEFPSSHTVARCS